ncbi:MAG: hypothetical protein N3F07_03375 [Candidatus Micrarchaeota archaeon]|nr:hypothetical protein [Candidatus Micrarchaeota archaeon]
MGIQNSCGSDMRKGFVALAVSLMLVFMLAFGCASAQPQEKSDKAIAPSPQPYPKESQDKQAEVSGKSPEVLADNRTGYEKINQTIAKAIEDGIYAKNVSYNYHSGKVDMQITLSIKDEKVADVSLEGINPDKVSAKYIAGVNGAIRELVVGKKLSEISLPKQVAGSSLTTAAFQKYVSELQESQ